MPSLVREQRVPTVLEGPPGLLGRPAAGAQTLRAFDDLKM
jgi:hypothetical protein